MTETPQPPAEAAPAPPAEAPKSNGMATAGMVLGIISAALLVVFCAPYLAIIVGVIGLILSVLGMKKAKQLNGVGAGKAKIGLICSIVGIVVGLVELILLLAFAKTVADKTLEDIQRGLEQYSNQPTP